jgi:CHAD domain-containing protein
MDDDTQAAHKSQQGGMKFCIKKNEPIANAIRRIADEQLSLARQQTARPKASANSIHAARKAIKRARAVFKLASAGEAAEFAKHEDRQLRDAGRLLAPIRDVHVQQLALKKLSICSDDQICRVLQQRLRDKKKQTMNSDGHISERFVATIDAVQAEATKSLNLAGEDAAAALKKTYRRARKCFTQAQEAPTGHKLHEWRKAVKNLWYQLQIVDEVTGREFKQLKKQADDIGVYLGDDHDMYLLLHVLADAKDSESRIVKRELRKLRTQLQKRAFKIAAKAFDLAPSAFHEKLCQHLNQSNN